MSSQPTTEPMDPITRLVIEDAGLDPAEIDTWRWDGPRLHVRLKIDVQYVDIKVTTVKP